MELSTFTREEFLNAAKNFVEISNKINDGWKLIEQSGSDEAYILKNTFIKIPYENSASLLKTDYVIFYNLSYGVPTFSFNIWNSSGVLLKLDEIRQMAFVNIEEKDFYSVITQQEHPIFHRPYFMVHPCHTEKLLSAFKNKTKNIIVTFLSLITPLIDIDLSVEYGL